MVLYFTGSAKNGMDMFSEVDMFGDKYDVSVVAGLMSCGNE